MPGKHNENLQVSISRLQRGNTYRDLSTICIIPTRGMISAKVCSALWGMMTPMNQNFYRHFVQGDEVGKAYNNFIQMVVDDKNLSKWKYILTIEEDNIPPPDGLLKLYENIDKFGAIGGLYWTKGDGGQPMIYGNPGEMPKNFRPQVPIPDALQECNGLGMGFTLFKLSMFKKVPAPWFQTIQEYVPGSGGRAYTQDLFFFEKAAQYGYRFAVDTRVKVGHLDVSADVVW